MRERERERGREGGGERWKVDERVRPWKMKTGGKRECTAGARKVERGPAASSPRPWAPRTSRCATGRPICTCAASTRLVRHDPGSASKPAPQAVYPSHNALMQIGISESSVQRDSDCRRRRVYVCLFLQHMGRMKDEYWQACIRIIVWQHKVGGSQSWKIYNVK